MRKIAWSFLGERFREDSAERVCLQEMPASTRIAEFLFSM